MADPLELVQVSAFDAARLNAIDAYAGLESTLASILGPLLGSPENARTIFFRITKFNKVTVVGDLEAVSVITFSFRRKKT